MHEVVANIARGGGFGVNAVGDDDWLLPRSPSELNLINDRLAGLYLNKNLTAKFPTPRQLGSFVKLEGSDLPANLSSLRSHELYAIGVTQWHVH